MVINSYSHCFTKAQLRLIIDDYLGLGPYFNILHRLVQQHVRNLEQSDIVHDPDRPHPIKIYTKDTHNQNLQEQTEDLQALNLNTSHQKQDNWTTFSSYPSKYYYIYPLEVILNLLESEHFYKQLPKNIIINNLLTTQNISIIIETLIIISEEMGKKIKATISNKLVRRINKNEDQVPNNQQKSKEDDKVEFPEQWFNQRKLLPQSRIQIIEEALFEDQIDEDMNQEQEPQCDLVKPEIPKIAFKRITPQYDIEESQCSYCRNYHYYLNEQNGQFYADQCLDRLSKEAIKYLKLISQTVTHFTVYMLQSNVTEIPNQIHTINRILNSIGIVITEDIYHSELNPKNQKEVQIINTRPKNLVEQLAPFHKAFENKNKNKNPHSYKIEQLLRMIIYSPTTGEVMNQLKAFQTEQFQKDISVFKNTEKEQKIKWLLQKQCTNMRQYQKQRLQIAQNTTLMKPIYKQLQFQQEEVVVPSTQPQFYNVLHQSSINSRAKQQLANSLKNSLDQAQSCSKNILINTKENKSLLIQPLQTLSKIFEDKCLSPKSISKISKKTTKQRNSIKKASTKYIEYISNNSSLMITNLKKSIINNNTIKSNFLSNITENKNPSVTKMSNIIDKKGDEELSDSQFKKILYTSYIKNNGIMKSQASGHHFPAAPPSVQTINTKSNMKKQNGYSSSLFQFMGRKQEQEQIQSMEKKQKEIYSKQLLNGQFVKNEIYNEIKLGTAKVYDCYVNAMKEIDNLNLNVNDGKNEENEQLTSSSRYKLSKSLSKKTIDIIKENSTKYNHTGIIRNQKYNKNIKSQLINHRSSFLNTVEKQNESKNRLIQTKLKKKITIQSENVLFKDWYGKQLEKRYKQTER